MELIAIQSTSGLILSILILIPRVLLARSKRVNKCSTTREQNVECTLFLNDVTDGDQEPSSQALDSLQIHQVMQLGTRYDSLGYLPALGSSASPRDSIFRCSAMLASILAGKR